MGQSGARGIKDCGQADRNLVTLRCIVGTPMVLWADTGASVAFTGTVNNYLKHTELQNLKKAIDNCKAEKCSDGAYKIIIDAYGKTSEANNASLATCTTQSCINEHVQLINEAKPLADDLLRSIDNGQPNIGVLGAMQRTTNLLDVQQKKVIAYEREAIEFAQYAKASCTTGTLEGCVQRYTDVKTGTIRVLQDAKESAADFWAEMAFDPNQSATKKFLSVTASTLVSLMPANTAEIALLAGPGLLGKIRPVGEWAVGVKGGVIADEASALGRIGGKANGPVLNGKAPNTVLNQQAVNDLTNGLLPGVTKNPNTGLTDVVPRTGVPREMPTSPNPSATAEDFALKALGREPTQAELSKGLMMNGGNCPGCWSAKSADGTYVTFRPAGSASRNTLDMTASVDIDFKSAGNAINDGKVVKLKFPQQRGQ